MYVYIFVSCSYSPPSLPSPILPLLLSSWSLWPTLQIVLFFLSARAHTHARAHIHTPRFCIWEKTCDILFLSPLSWLVSSSTLSRPLPSSTYSEIHIPHVKGKVIFAFLNVTSFVLHNYLPGILSLQLTWFRFAACLYKSPLFMYVISSSLISV